jgi:predicted nuclease of predicted toxin-antitoxin system
MRILADVHVKSAYLNALRADGHEVTLVVDTLEPTASDARIVDRARETNAVVMTNDTKDFARFDDHPGVIIVPQTGTSAGEMAAAVSRIEQLVPDLSGQMLYATDWV